MSFERKRGHRDQAGRQEFSTGTRRQNWPDIDVDRHIPGRLPSGINLPEPSHQRNITMLSLKASRRAVLTSTIAAIPALVLGRQVMAESTSATGDAFQFEVTRTESEWRALLSDDEYKILRQGATEVPKSDPLWDSTEAGHYACRGCDLEIYDARWKVVLDAGWLFFRHSQPNAVLTSIDRSLYERFRGPDAETESALVPEAGGVESLTPEELDILADFIAIEVHCRRCGSHFGHIIWTDKKLVHCVNGTSLEFSRQQG